MNGVNERCINPFILQIELIEYSGFHITRKMEFIMLYRFSSANLCSF